MMNQFQSPFKIKEEEFEFTYAFKGKSVKWPKVTYPKFQLKPWFIQFLDDELILMMPGTRPVCGIDLWFDFNTDADMELVETNHFGQIISIHKGKICDTKIG